MHSVDARTNMSAQVRPSPPTGDQLAAGLTHVDGRGVNAPSGVGPRPEGPRASAVPPPTGDPAARRPTVDQASWRTVQHRRQIADEAESDSAIIWNAPPDTDIEALQARLIGLNSKTATPLQCAWRGAGCHRHVVVSFNTNHMEQWLHSKADLQQKCADIGLKLTLKTRDWKTRVLHRKRRAAATAPPAQDIGEPCGAPHINPYAALPIERPAPPPARSRSHHRRITRARRQRDRGPRVAPIAKAHHPRSLRVGSLNIQGSIANKVGEIEAFLAAEKYDVVALQETRLATNKEITFQGYTTFLQDKAYRSSPADGGGVAILVATHLAPAVHKLKCTHRDQLWVRISGCGGNPPINFCSAYMPQDQSPLATRTEAWTALATSAAEYDTENSYVVIAGDLNARLGTPQTPEEERAIGTQGQPGPRTANGRSLASLLLATDLISLDGQRRPGATSQARTHVRSDYWFTRRDKAHGTKNQIDYILASRALAGEHDFSFWVDYSHLDTDHHLVGATVASPRKMVRRRGRKQARKRFRLEKMIQKSSKADAVAAATEAKDDYEVSLLAAFNDFNPDEQDGAPCPHACGAAPCACAAVTDFVTRTERAVEEAVGSQTSGGKFSRPWFDNEVRTAITKRRAAHATFLTSDSPEDWETFRRLRRATSRLISTKRTEAWERYLADIEAAYATDHRQLWRLVKRLTPAGKKAAIAPVRNKRGVLAQTEESITEAWAEHQESLGRPQPDPHRDHTFTQQVHARVASNEYFLQSQAHTPADSEGLDNPFTDAELEEGIAALQYHKAPAHDGTRNPMYKCGGPAMRGYLLQLFNHLHTLEAVPADWQRAAIVNIYKDGDPADPGNYRGIALISCLGKLYFSLWARRLTKFAEGRLTEEQGGFRWRRSTEDQALVYHETVLRRQRMRLNTYVCFIDFKKAFDTIWHDGLWERLWTEGVRGKAWRVMRTLYANISAQVRVGDNVSRAVPMYQGVRQGCPLSPVLFNFFIDELSKRLAASGYGVKYGATDKLLHALLYADDVVLLAASPAALQALIDIVTTFCNEWHMNINISKSKVMTVGDTDGIAFPEYGDDSDFAALAAAADINSDSDDPEGDDADARVATEWHQAIATHAATPWDADDERPSPWTCRGTPLQEVKRYKYLGLWVTRDLSWSHHVQVTIAKATKRTQSLSGLFNNNRVPARAKALVWLSYVRPLLEYGCAVWTPTMKQADSMERVQHTAGVKIFKLNAKTSRLAVRSLLGVTSLALRRTRAQLCYYTKLLTLDPDSRLVRFITESALGAGTRGQERRHWKKRIAATLTAAQADPALSSEHTLLRQSLHRNANILPRGLDATLPDTNGYPWYAPVARWRRAAATHANAQQRGQLLDPGAGTTLELLQRACTEQDATAVPKFPLTRLPNKGPNQIRVRFLAGTSALNGTLSKWNEDRIPCCPWMARCTSTAREDAIHFLLHCEGGALPQARATYAAALQDACTCTPEEDGDADFLNCSDFYERLDDAGKALWMLGGPVDGRAPEPPVDAAAAQYTLTAWKSRSDRLEKDSMRSGSTSSGSQHNRSNRNRSSRSSRTNSSSSSSSSVGSSSSSSSSSNSSISRSSSNSGSSSSSSNSNSTRAGAAPQVSILRYFVPRTTPPPRTLALGSASAVSGSGSNGQTAEEGD